jgi:hypothetical protein
MTVVECGTYGKRRNACRILVAKLQGKDQLGDIAVDEKI